MVALGSVVTCASLAEDEVVGTGKLAERGTDRTHGAGLEVDKGGVGHVAAADGRVIVHVDVLMRSRSSWRSETRSHGRCRRG